MPTRRPLIRNPATNALEDMQPADNLPGVPLGGATGNVLTKNSGADHDASWVAPSGGALNEGLVMAVAQLQFLN